MHLITDEQTTALVRRLLCEYIEQCKDLRINNGTASRLLGISATRLNQIRKDVKEGGPVAVNLGVFLRAKQFLASIPTAKSAEVLPAASKNGAAQNPVLRFYGAEETTDAG